MLTLNFVQGREIDSPDKGFEILLEPMILVATLTALALAFGFGMRPGRTVDAWTHLVQFLVFMVPAYPVVLLGGWSVGHAITRADALGYDEPPSGLRIRRCAPTQG
ncbi:MAG: hypothetical protein GY842_20500 [bacterium]|nr:hypothetical protein [bacterium]